MRNLYKSDIVRLAKPVEDLKYYSVYFLLEDEEIVYVGSSKAPYNRIHSHFSDKKFNKYHTLKFSSMEEALITEEHYIKTFKPKYNIAHNPDKEEYNKIKNKEIENLTQEEILIKEKRESFDFEKQELIDKRIEIKNNKNHFFSKDYEDSLFETSVKINIPSGTYIKKKDGIYYFNIENKIYTYEEQSNSYFLNRVKYKHPTEIYGNISNLKIPKNEYFQ